MNPVLHWIVKNVSVVVIALTHVHNRLLQFKMNVLIESMI